ncbi:MAG TPA: hypothetical protein VL172_05830 [Kofleriaceae bacterium]|jgi:hypothetical protein|nr:hypothetical protein [Kofleriaceae bacterium]
MADLVDDFLEHTAAEDAKLHKALAKLGDARAPLGKVLERFDYDHTGVLDERQRELARRVLRKVHRPSAKGFDLLVGALDYLDVNTNQRLEHSELTMAIEILEMFSKAESVNDTLSQRELEMLHAVLRRLAGGPGPLDEAGRTRLRDSLWDPDAFLAEEKQRNPELEKLMKG